MKVLAVILAAAVLPAFAPAARAQNLDDIFRKVNPSVVVVRAKGRDVGAGGVTRFNETGSGVLISASGKVMTAAHVVNAMDEITVEGVAGEVVRAKIISSDAAADVSLLQLERVTAAMQVARIGDSSTVRVGQQVMVVGAPYGLAHSMRSEEHTSELQSLTNLVCRLLLEKKKKADFTSCQADRIKHTTAS